MSRQLEDHVRVGFLRPAHGPEAVLGMSEPPESLTPAVLAAALVFGLQFDGRAG